jgi:hypothetical protein
MVYTDMTKFTPTFIKTALLLLPLIGSSALANTNASLIINGSFEQLTFADNSTSIGRVFNTDLKAYENKQSAWDVFYTLPGWETTFGNGIELQKNVAAYSKDGSHHVELDSHPRGASNSVMTQTVDSLTIGAEYLLEFYYKPQTREDNDNGIIVFWYDTAVDFSFDMTADLVVDSTRRLTRDWVLQSITFTANAESMKLSFASFGKENTLGGLVDNVSLKRVANTTSVPEPSTFALLFVATGLLFVPRRKSLH